MKFSIITIILNDKQNIENTIVSVLEQTIDLEYIVIDGGSSDGTLDVIDKYRDKIDVVISEQDNGIYDAMNKAIDLATGEWICFMNSGDIFLDASSVEKLFSRKRYKDTEILYGDYIVKYAKKEKLFKAKHVKEIWKGSVFSHQSCFVKREILLEYKFNLSNKITADYELFYTLYKESKTFEYIPTVIALVSSGGVSDVKRIESIASRWKVIDKNLKVNIYYTYLVLLEIIKKIVKLVARRR